MSSQFEKRQLKKAEAVKAQIEAKREDIRAKAANEPVYTQTGLDIYTPDGGKTYGVAEISYNPETGDAKVTNTFSITRIVALTYLNQKIALNTLKKGK